LDKCYIRTVCLQSTQLHIFSSLYCKMEEASLTTYVLCMCDFLTGSHEDAVDKDDEHHRETKERETVDVKDDNITRRCTKRSRNMPP